MTVEQFLATKPTREQAIKMICRTANREILHIKEVPGFRELCSHFNLDEDDFYDDQSAFTEYERTHIGLYRWIPKEDVI